MADTYPRAIAFSARSPPARINAAFKWKRDVGDIDRTRYIRLVRIVLALQQRPFTEARRPRLCRCRLLWIGRRETDSARDSSRFARGSCGRDRLGSDLPRDALRTWRAAESPLSIRARCNSLRFLWVARTSCAPGSGFCEPLKSRTSARAEHARYPNFSLARYAVVSLSSYFKNDSAGLSHYRRRYRRGMRL